MMQWFFCVACHSHTASTPNYQIEILCFFTYAASPCSGMSRLLRFRWLLSPVRCDPWQGLHIAKFGCSTSHMLQKKWLKVKAMHVRLNSKGVYPGGSTFHSSFSWVGISLRVMLRYAHCHSILTGVRHESTQSAREMRWQRTKSSECYAFWIIDQLGLALLPTESWQTDG